MKAVILAAGKGTRLAELGIAHKSLALINGRRVIDYSLELVAGEHLTNRVKEIILVVGHNAQHIIDAVGQDYKGIPVNYVMQEKQLGIAHAIIVAKPHIKDDFVMCLSDEILRAPRMDAMIDFYHKTKADCVCGAVVDPNDFRMKAIALDVDQDATVVRITEKPDSYYNDFRGIGECIFNERMLDLLEALQPNPRRGEYEMGDWIRLGVTGRLTCKVFDLADAYINVNTIEDMNAAFTF